MKSVSLLGSTGSIGTQTLDVIRKNNDIKVVALAAGTRVKELAEQTREFKPQLVSVGTQEKAKEARTATDNDDDGNELIFISTLPWLSYTSLVQPAPMPADSNPRITWGKFVKQDSVIRIPVTVLCNHALVDGYHISQFYDILGQQLKKLTDDIN